MHQFIPFNNIPLSDWKASRNKWIQCLVNNEEDWQTCSVCGTVRETHKYDDCTRYCPLAITKWCMGDRVESKLSECYTPEGQHDNYQTHSEWLQNVEDYLNWLDLEIEAMQYAEDLLIFGELEDT